MAEETSIANNDLSTGALFYYRKLYKIRAYPDGVARPADLWYDKNLYGKINRIQDALVVDPARLKILKSSGDKELQVLDFVADAFRDFRKFYMKKAASGGLSGLGGKGTAGLERVRPSIKIKPKRAWVDPQILYHNHMKRVYDKSASLVFSKRQEEITSIDAFVPMFVNTLETVSSRTPISLTSFITSKYCTPLVSGLMIELDEQSHDADPAKYRSWLKDPNYEFYANAARLYGFVVDKNAPWRLIADVFSSTMLNYMQKYGTTKYNCFNTCYYSTHLSDLRKLRSYAYDFYTAFAGANPTVVIPTVRGAKVATVSTVEAGITETTFGFRAGLSLEEYYDAYDTGFWVGVYARLRAQEMELNWDESTLRHVSTRARKIYKYVDFYSAMDYINDKTKGYYYPETFLRQQPEEER
ncbi:hypothetical protein CMI47_19915 [Candidatus Pacearchaeota archaeon]|nr:hypothetical protein [Candidatus Pacearchaeota archaeon]